MGDSRRDSWDARHAATAAPSPPSPFVVTVLDALARRGCASSRVPRALDLACGRGRHTLLLARRGFHVIAVDYARPALAALASRARNEGLAIDAVVADVTEWPLPSSCFDVVLVVDFLERALFPALRAAVAPGGVLVVETFLVGQERLGHPRNPAFLLRPGELHDVCADWMILAEYEGEVGAATRACRAGIAAERPPTR